MPAEAGSSESNSSVSLEVLLSLQNFEHEALEQLVPIVVLNGN